jgi:hypothetical protein
MVEDRYPLEKAVEAVTDAVASLNDPIGRNGAGGDRGSPRAPLHGPRVTVADLGPAPSASIDELTKTSEDLKRRIDEARKRSDMPIDAQLGSPDFEQRAADGRFDRPDDEDE